jgi:hypothetical protein
MALKRVKMTKCSSKDFPRLYSSSTVAAHSTYNPKIKGSNPATGSGRVKMKKNIQVRNLLGYALVAQWQHIRLMILGSWVQMLPL